MIVETCSMTRMTYAITKSSSTCTVIPSIAIFRTTKASSRCTRLPNTFHMISGLISSSTCTARSTATAPSFAPFAKERRGQPLAWSTTLRVALASRPLSIVISSMRPSADGIQMASFPKSYSLGRSPSATRLLTRHGTAMLGPISAIFATVSSANSDP